MRGDRLIENMVLPAKWFFAIGAFLFSCLGGAIAFASYLNEIETRLEVAEKQMSITATTEASILGKLEGIERRLARIEGQLQIITKTSHE